MNLLATGAFVNTIDELSAFRELGFDVFFQKDERAELVVDASEVDVVIGNGLFLWHDVDLFTRLKFIQLTSVGFDRVPMEKVHARSIAIRNARGVYNVPMAEYVIGEVLAFYKNLFFFKKNQTARQWIKKRDLVELAGKTVCIVGAGSVGTEIAKRFYAFGTTVLGVDLFPEPREPFECVYPLSQLDTVLAMSDVVVLTLPLTDETRHFFDFPHFNNMKKDALLVNVARGAVVDLPSLCRALDERQIGGAILDVFEEEPLSEDCPLWHYDNAILTPHISYVSVQNQVRLYRLVLDNVSNWLQSVSGC